MESLQSGVIWILCIKDYVARTWQHWNGYDTWTCGKFL